MEVTGKIVHNLGEVSGVSKAGNAWKKHEYVLETEDSFPKLIHFDFFGDRASQYPLEVGDRITLSFDIDSREYMGRWFTSIRGWKAEKVGDAVAKPDSAPIPSGGSEKSIPPVDLGGSDSSDDLPF